ncbi:MAG: RsfS/YbeB/iojap family protein, partial [Pseudomonadales bacterium]
MKNANAKNEELKNIIIAALEDLKAVDVVVLSVAESSSVTDWMIIASGTSNRHVKSLANNIEVDAKQQ